MISGQEDSQLASKVLNDHTEKETGQHKLSPMSLFSIVIMLNSQSLAIYFEHIKGR